MKKVWTYIKFEFAFVIGEMSYFAIRYVLTHRKSFNKTIRDFAFNVYMRSVKRFYALYDELEAIEH